MDHDRYGQGIDLAAAWAVFLGQALKWAPFHPIHVPLLPKGVPLCNRNNLSVAEVDRDPAFDVILDSDGSHKDAVGVHYSDVLSPVARISKPMINRSGDYVKGGVS
eukprot:CAMPEP_0114115696 /NCGR_PEP_ID=MMETSP0043_2-20121206/4104_1 /TAXON_ID=464988 /ORGANISM="Hemiselmis andersenii, Strain CCMP644" /LENGTH=105 /DNA_ID=CAMNT_0001207971 /DNA_START=436 /DNA_END=750 /DNA_ORIENTATION=-